MIIEKTLVAKMFFCYEVKQSFLLNIYQKIPDKSWKMTKTFLTAQSKCTDKRKNS